jgi:hypothetical protein
MMHRFASRPIGILALLFCLGAIAFSSVGQAQATGWQATTQPGGYKVARVTGSGIANAMALTCERGVPVLAVNLVTPAPTNPVQLSLEIDEGSYPITLTRNGRTNVWVAVMRDVTAIDALAGGSRLRVSTRGQTIGTLPTAGARDAIASALTGCYRPAPATTASLAPTPAMRPPATRTGVTEGVGCPSLATVERWGRANVPQFNGATAFCGDFTGDGLPDAFAILHYDFIGGNAQGQEAALFQNAGGTLRLLRRVPEFYGQTESAVFDVGRITLQMTVLLPSDARCCPTGKETRQVDTTTGRHWQLVDAKPAALAGKATGPLSRLSITLGPYVSAAETCRAPSQVTWFEPGGYWEISTDSRFFSEIAEVTRDGADYLLKARPDPNDPPPDPAYPDDDYVGVRPAGPGRIVMMIQDDIPLKLCTAAEIPARFRP